MVTAMELSAMCVARGATATGDHASVPSQSSHHEGTAELRHEASSISGWLTHTPPHVQAPFMVPMIHTMRGGDFMVIYRSLLLTAGVLMLAASTGPAPAQLA